MTKINIGHTDTTPTSIGSRADLKAGVDISKVFGGYFSNLEAAQAFVDIGIKNIERELPQNIKLADFGGGQGFLTNVVSNYLIQKGHNINAFVIDSNPLFLEEVKRNNPELNIYQCNLENCNFENTDIITMRAVNHYNPPNKQLEILKSSLLSLKEKGFLISQISSGSKENCELRSAIVNLPSLERGAKGENYHWTSIEEYISFLEKTGFGNINVAGYAPDCKWSPEEQWDRFHAKETTEAQNLNNITKLEIINKNRERFLSDSYDLIRTYISKHGEICLGINFDQNGIATINYKYPIIISQKII